MRADKKGYTLIELIVVIVVLGILSGIAIAKFTRMKEEAFIASMKSDLRNLAIYEMNYYVDQEGFFAGDGSAQGFVATPGVTVSATADPGPPASWTAAATHSKTARTCQISARGGSVGEITCT